MNKQVKESNVNYKVNKDQLADIAPEIDKVANDGDSVEVRAEADINYKVKKDQLGDIAPEINKVADDGDSIQVVEALKMDIYPILHALGINLSNKTPEQQQSIKSYVKKFIELLNQKGVTDLVIREDDELPEIPDEEKMERGDEYGVPVYEDLDKTMEELKESNAPTVKLQENVRPRIKKSDLINYIKSKK